MILIDVILLINDLCKWLGQMAWLQETNLEFNLLIPLNLFIVHSENEYIFRYSVGSHKVPQYL